MKAKTFTQPPVMPVKKAKDFNDWQKHLHTQLSKITGVNPLIRAR